MASPRFFALALVLALGPPLNVDASPGTRTFDSTYGFSATYPSDWHLQSRQNHFYIESFPPSRAVRAVRVPPGEASIGITVPIELSRSTRPRPPSTFEEWLNLIKNNREGLVITKRNIIYFGKNLPVTVIASRCCADPPYQISVAWCFTIYGHMFMADLQYWEHEKKSEMYLAILENVVKTVRVKGGPSGTAERRD